MLPSEEVGWLSKNVPGLSLKVLLYLLCVFCVHSNLLLTSVGFLYTWLTLSEGWGFWCFVFFFFTINLIHFAFRSFFNFVSELSYS